MRIQLELPETTVTRLQQLMLKGEVKTYSDIFSYAFSGLEWMVKERELGRMIVSTDQDFKHVKEITMPILETVASKVLPQPAGQP